MREIYFSKKNDPNSWDLEPTPTNNRSKAVIKEAMQQVQEMAQKALRPEIKHLPGDPPHVVHITKPDGTLERVELTPGYRDLIISRIDDLIAIGKAHFDDKIKTKQRLLITYNKDRVTLIFDHSTGHEKAFIPLISSEEYKFFCERRNQPLIDVNDLRMALRIDLRKTYKDAKLIDQISKLDFNNLDRSSTSAERGRESMGRSIEQQVATPEDLPDPYQVFSIRKYTNPDLDVRFDLQCALDPDVNSRRWFLKPIEDSFIEFDSKVADLIGNKLRTEFKDSEVTVYEGTYSTRSAGFYRRRLAYKLELKKYELEADRLEETTVPGTGPIPCR